MQQRPELELTYDMLQRAATAIAEASDGRVEAYFVDMSDMGIFARVYVADYATGFASGASSLGHITWCCAPTDILPV